MKLARTEKRKRRKIRSIPKRTMDKGNGGGGEREDSGFRDSLFESGREASVGEAADVALAANKLHRRAVLC